MLTFPVPYKKLSALRDRLALNDEDLKSIEPFRNIFVGKKNEFARYLHDFFSAIPETRIILERSQRPGFLLEAWAHWFESLFKETPGPEFFSRLWRVGLRHVEVNLDQRYTNLGFSVARQYCHTLALSNIPLEKTGTVLGVIDKLLDLCLLIETTAYIEATTRCDLEVMKGIADMIRNPITVIGGNVKRLLKKAGPESPLSGAYESLLSESTRLEHMVLDIRRYIEMLNSEPELRMLLLEDLIKSALAALRAETHYVEV
ncbi:MAG: protoglobin domain-containing protein, partial [Nitrospirae bacterium]|nr:protoglobin domain-containing protein [Nitrospirota bacterium]